MQEMTPEDILDSIQAMPDNTPGLDSVSKDDLVMISWQAAKLLYEMFHAIEGGIK